MIRLIFISSASCLTLIAYLASAASSNSESFAATQVALSSDLCGQTIEAPPTEGSINYSVAEGLFRTGRFDLSARAYYQTFVCSYSDLFRGVNPLVYDAKDFGPFENALLTATKGKYAQAASELENLKHGLPQFTEAGYVAGVYRWCAGDHRAAIRLWRKTVAGPHFAMSDDDSDPGQSASANLLKWARSQ